jgi:predicted O-methyltransferase YrrM
MDQILEEILKSGKIKLENGKHIELHSNISQREGVLIQKIIYDTRPKNTLEIGLAYGISALFICEALKNVNGTRHLIIDPNQNGGEWGDSWDGVGLYNLKRAGYEDLVEFIAQPSFQALPQLVAAGRQVDFAFIDGWHTFDYTLVDFFYIDKMLRVGGVIVFDDVDWPSIRKVCRYVSTNYSYDVISDNKATLPRFSMKRRFANRIIHYSSRLKNICKPEFLNTDSMLGINGSCVAFRKVATDSRRWDFHKEF